MRQLLFATSLLLLPLFAGCGLMDGSHCSTGWRFEVIKPPVMMAPAMINSSAGTTAVTPIGTTGGSTDISTATQHSIRQAIIVPSTGQPSPSQSIRPLPVGPVQPSSGACGPACNPCVMYLPE